MRRLAPEALKPPESPPPPAKVSQGVLSEAPLTAAEKLASNMPDVNQRFALVVIAKYLGNIKKWRKRAMGGDASAKRAAAKLAKARRMTEKSKNTPTVFSASMASEPPTQRESPTHRSVQQSQRGAAPAPASRRYAPPTTMC